MMAKLDATTTCTECTAEDTEGDLTPAQRLGALLRWYVLDAGAGAATASELRWGALSDLLEVLDMAARGELDAATMRAVLTG